MAYIPRECTIEEYENVIYSGDAKHRLYVKHGSTVIGTNGDENASPFASKLTWKRRFLANGSTTLTLDNFISQEIELVLHDYEIQDLTEEIEIKIGTYIDSVEDYVYVPLGIYKIQDNPTTDKKVTTYKLRDRTVNFDFKYNAKPLIDANEELGVQTTLGEILDDICGEAGVEFVGDTYFLGNDDLVGVYDNTITARVYVSYIAERAGCIPIINRQGQLDFIPIVKDSLTEKVITPDKVEKFTNGDNFKITKVVYEAGELFYQQGDGSKDTLFLNAANPYITQQSQIDEIYDVVKDFEINSFNTGKVLGNPTFDPWDLVSLTYQDNTYKTLAQYDLSFGGTMTMSFDTTIKYNDKKTNTTSNDQAIFQKTVYSVIDNVNATLTTTIKDLGTSLENGLQGLENEFQETANGIKESLTQVGGNNYILDSMGALKENAWTNIESITDTYTRLNATGQSAIMLMNTTSTEEQDNSIKQKINCKNGTYTISFKYLKTIELATVKFKINNIEYNLSEYNQLTDFQQTISVTTGEVNLEFISNADNSCYIIDLIMNDGTSKLNWSQHANETITNTVKIGEGIQVESNTTNTIWRADSDGSRVLNKTTKEVVREDTAKGTKTKEFESTSTSKVNGALFTRVGSQTWISGV